MSVNMVEAHSPVQHQRAPDFEASKQLGHDAVRSDQWGASEFASDHYEASSSFASTHLLGADPGASLYTPGSRIPSVGSSHRYESRAGNGTSPDSGMERSIQPGAPEGLSQNLGFADTEPRGDGPLEWDVRRERAPPPPSLKHEAAGRRRTRPRKSGGTRRRSTTEAGAVEAARSTGQARLPSPRRRTSEVVMEVQEDILKQVLSCSCWGRVPTERAQFSFYRHVWADDDGRGSCVVVAPVVTPAPQAHRWTGFGRRKKRLVVFVVPKVVVTPTL